VTDVDRWGFDPRFVTFLDPLMTWRWPVRVRGAASIPPSGPAVVVLARGLDPAAPLAVAAALRRATGRPARFLGVPDVAAVGPLLRRVGGAVARPEELAGLLRAGHLVVLPLGRAFRPGAVPLDEEDLVPAVDAGDTVVPAALGGAGWRRAWALDLAPPVVRRTAGPAALAQGVREGIASLQRG
jgi:hypothetical protein